MPFLFKQWGAWIALSQAEQDEAIDTAAIDWTHNLGDDDDSARVGKKTAGRTLDGREWNEFPSLEKVRS